MKIDKTQGDVIGKFFYQMPYGNVVRVGGGCGPLYLNGPCENILCGYLHDGDLVFVILKGIYGF
jgi:hypothetical protein